MNKISVYIKEFYNAIETGQIENDAAYITAGPAPRMIADSLSKHCKELNLDGYMVYIKR